jgi:alanine-glyoxylate transaminase/serine-glyoxylate transaminase/serine-pyruvate transaminase
VPFSLDLELLRRYWIQRPASYHHTAPVLSIYGLHEALRQVHLEGLEARWRRHRASGAYLQHGVQALGLGCWPTPGANCHR